MVAGFKRYADLEQEVVDTDSRRLLNLPLLVGSMRPRRGVLLVFAIAAAVVVVAWALAGCQWLAVRAVSIPAPPCWFQVIRRCLSHARKSSGSC